MLIRKITLLNILAKILKQEVLLVKIELQE